MRISDAHQHSDENDGSTYSDITSAHPLTSTTHDGRLANQLRVSPEDESLQNSQITVLFEGVGFKTQSPNDIPDNQHHSQMMMSSGYVTNENTDVTCHSSWVEGEREPAGALLLDMTQSTVTGSDIISHAPVEGAVLEEESFVPHPKPVEDVTKLTNSPSEPDEGPYRMSLQNLLKKSQEYRRRQRLLRSQAKALTSLAEEHSLSDKENEELLPKQIWKMELKKAREKRKEKTDHINSDVSNQTCIDVLLHNEDNAQIEDVPQPSSTVARSLYVSKQVPSRSISTVGKRFTNIPTPKFCLSPVRHSKKGSRIPGLVRKSFSESKTSIPADRNANISSSLNDLEKRSEQAEQITQLELNLFSLTALISDLESTLSLSQTDQTGSPLDNLNTTCLKMPSTATFFESGQVKLPAKDCGISPQNSNQPQVRHPGVLTDVHIHNHTLDEEGSSLIGLSYDVDAPSSLWKQLTPEAGGQEGLSHVKRRLLMNEGEAESYGQDTGITQSSTPRVKSLVLQTSAQTAEDHVTILMEEERRCQQDLLQSLAVRYQCLRSMSFPCPSAGSRLEDTSSSILASSVDTHAEFTDVLHTTRRDCLTLTVSCRPLLAALVRGFLTRRLLHTERVSQLIRTIKDTRVFLLTLQHQTGGSSRSDLMLQERVMLQLRAARYDLHEIFFTMSCTNRMLMIRCDRELSRDRRLRAHDHRVKGSLSAATRKALERKKLALLQKKLSDRKKISCDEEKWNLVPKICRVSKKISPVRGAR